MSRIGRVLVVLAVLVALVAGAGLVSADDATATVQQVEADDETPEPHEHPDEADGEGDSDRQAEWLTEWLARSLAESTTDLREGEYEDANAAIGEEFDERLLQLSEVAEQTGDEEDELAAEAFGETRENQRELIDDVEEYEETYELYLEAREEGDEERARELAHRLNETYDSIEENSADLQESYDRLETETDIDTSQQREAVEQTRSDIESRHEEVREEEFTPTELTLTTESTDASFAEPATIEGTLTTVDGDPVADEEIVLEIGDQDRSLTTTTDSSGEFSTEYRPTTLPLDTTEVEVRYAPQSQSPYDSSSATLAVNVEQVEPTVDITETPDEAAFGDPVTVGGSVHVETVGVDSIPVVVLVDGERLGTAETDEDGEFELTGPLPANVATGEADVRVVVPLEDRALAGTDAAVSMTVLETPGELTIEAEQQDEVVHIDGRLRSDDGTAVGEQPIRIEAGDHGTIVRTDEDGRYETEVAIPDGVDDELPVEATYSEQGTNIGDVSVSIVVEVDTEEEAGIPAYLRLLLGIPAEMLADPFGNIDRWLGVGGVITVLGIVVYIVRKHGGRETEVADDTDTSMTATTAVSGEPDASLLAVARTLLDAGETDLAIQTAYTALRQGTADHEAAQTHWEFYDTCRANGFSDGQIDALRSLTEQFERASFSPAVSSEEEATSAVETAERLAAGS